MSRHALARLTYGFNLSPEMQELWCQNGPEDAQKAIREHYPSSDVSVEGRSTGIYRIVALEILAEPGDVKYETSLFPTPGATVNLFEAALALGVPVADMDLGWQLVVEHY